MIRTKIDYWFNRTSSQLIYDYSQWYYTTKEWCENTAIEYNIETNKVAGILSALSVMKEFSHNQKLVKQFLECQTCGHMGSALLKANLIYGLENSSNAIIMNILNGRKTSSFFHNIMYPGSSEYLTVDFRMWKFFKKDEWKHITPKRYDEMEKVFQETSLDMKISVPSLQAVCWCITKYHGKNKH